METTKLGECDVRRCVFNEQNFSHNYFGCSRKYISLDGKGKCTSSLKVDCATRGGHKFIYTNKNGKRICDICEAIEIEEEIDYHDV